MIAGMTAIQLLAAAWLMSSAWAQSRIEVQTQNSYPKQPRETGRMGKVRLARDVMKIKEKCRLRFIASADDLFVDGTAEFADSAQRVLSELGPLLGRQEWHPIEIEGHSDGLGDPAQNRRLSEKRAHAVEHWLTAHDFLTPGTAEVHGFGKSRPVAAEVKTDGSDDVTGRQKNRRIELVVTTCR